MEKVKKYTSRKIKAVSAAIALLMILSIFAAGCEKDEGDPSVTSAKAAVTTAVAAKTSAKASAATSASASATVEAATERPAVTEEAVQNDETAGDEDEYSDEEAPESGVATSEQVRERPVFDLKGRKIIYATASTSYTYDYFAKLNPEFITLTKRLDYLEQLYNCDIELVPQAGGWGGIQNNLMTNCIAGTYWADAMMFVGSWTMKFHNFVQPLNDFIDFSDPKVHSNPGQADLEWNGKYYSILHQRKIAYEEMIAYNRDIFGREGLTDPMELQRAGQWTWTAMLDAALKATRDLDGDGIVDQWGIVRDTVQSINSLVKKMVASNDSWMIDTTQGGYRLGLADHKSLKALYFLNDLQNVHKTGSIYNATKDFRLGFAAMAFSNMAETRKAISEYPEGAGFVLYPKGPDTDKYVILNTSAGGWSGAMPYHVQEPEKISQIIYGMCAVYDDGYPDYVAQPDIKTSFSTYVFSEADYETLELQKSIIESEGAKMDPYAYLTSDLDSIMLAGTNSLVYKIMMQNVPVQSALDTSREVMQDKINTLVQTYMQVRN